MTWPLRPCSHLGGTTAASPRLAPTAEAAATTSGASLLAIPSSVGDPLRLRGAAPKEDGFRPHHGRRGIVRSFDAVGVTTPGRAERAPPRPTRLLHCWGRVARPARWCAPSSGPCSRRAWRVGAAGAGSRPLPQWVVSLRGRLGESRPGWVLSCPSSDSCPCRKAKIRPRRAAGRGWARPPPPSGERGPHRCRRWD